MNLTVFWSLLLSLFKLLTNVFAMTINLDRESLETPVWIMSKAGDRMPVFENKNKSGSNYNYLSDDVQPFINWNGVLKMVNKYL